ncbi:hypothetical protein Acy02nite_60780 [Actinoplanes cyaneus]|uniref:OmpR/PhoB-type domain-containing protein n=1 Tax=Actinoplanes cyaneus TaxID=52696 RepID=A0A919M6X7_9ACTN|nr:BTAD domain-containing putative transcriptional regulator [Actinoplanes cyaneus]MCW2141721.1 DNA-binding transcriptional activator of the SARP family [Actinoplanes cyaneus]GID68197.1 hypothetical protein Acy02nite_60780 [Actinoplanes cyaneus]
MERADTPAMRFAVLGPVQVWRGETELVIPSRYQRLLLALLLARTGRLVEMSDLIDLLWEGEPPPTAVNMVHRYVGALRRILEPGLSPRTSGTWLIRDVGGYRLLTGPCGSDLVEFREQIGAARRLAGVGDHAAALDAYLDALQLYRGRCATGLGPTAELHPEFVAIEQEYLAATREATRTAMACGGATRILPLVRAASVRNPLDEALLADLLLLLAADGKQSEAITRYGEVRERLAEELGVNPGPELRDAYGAVLRHGEPSIVPDRLGEVPVAPPATEAGIAVNPAQLPPDLGVFVGRTSQVAEAMASLTDRSASLPILAIDGMPGVGKTTLAVHVAHRVAAAFPDGQLYADLRGFHPDTRSADPSEVLHAFLVALGTSPADIPASLDSRSALYRSALTTRRMLVLLDNVRNADHVRPLLPGTAGNAVLITSRGRLNSLAISNGAILQSLDVLSVAEARQCFTERVAPAGTVQESAALAEIVDQCGRLPLALAIVAARATADVRPSLVEIAAEMKRAHGTLDAFSDEGLDRDLRAVFNWSYHLLSPGAAHLLRLLARHRAPDISVQVAAGLIGGTPAQAREQLAELLRTRLVNRSRGHHYHMHYLVRVYAGELCTARTAGDRSSFVPIRKAS